jgi:predicted RND superfamily exporter protein
MAGESSRLARLLTRLALRKPVHVLVLGALVCIAGILLATQLSIATDLAELLPPKAPSVVALRQLSQRVGGTGSISIAIESNDGTPGPLREYVPLLGEELKRQLGPELLTIRYSRKDLDDFYRKFAAYYVSLDDMEKWQQELATAIAKQNPAYVDLDEHPTDPVKQLADDVRAKQQKLHPSMEIDPQTGLLMAEHGRLSVVFVRPASNTLDLAGSKGILEQIQKVVESTHPEAHGVTVDGYTGSIPLAISEVGAIRRDIISTALLVLLGVGGIIIVYFRGARELILMSSAVTIGAAVALGFAELWIGHVNAQTAFLGAIIVGTGINYGIIFLDRYRQARQREEVFEQALETACAQTLRATGIAALSTAVSFGVLAAGQVESFHQFGWIGGLGILVCWIATFTVVPACIVLGDRHRKPALQSGFRTVTRMFEAIGRACVRAPRVVVGVTIVLAVTGVTLAFTARHHVIETDLRKLGTRSAESSGIEALDNRLRSMDDRSSSPAVIATDVRADTKPVCQYLNDRAKTDLKGIIRRCYTMDDLFPQDLAQRQPLIAKLRHDLDAVDEDELDDQQKKDLADLRRALSEAPPADRDLPPELSEFFVERDGSIGKLAYVEPNNEHIEKNLYAFTDAMRSITLPSGKVIQSSGDLVVFADVLRAMRRDATYLTIAAALLVLVVLGLVSRRLDTFVRVGGSLVAGVAVMFGVAVLLGQKLNFFNFVALPTTFGIGIDYAINIEERLRQRGRGELAKALGESAPAVVLASLTSIIGYASLVPAASRALSSFGVLAIIGEVCCVVVAVVAVPALWAMSARSSGERKHAR